MKVLSMMLLCLCLAAWSVAWTQEDSADAVTMSDKKDDTVRSDEQVISEIIIKKKSVEDVSRNVPNTKSIISSRQTENVQISRTLPEALKETPSVMIQKTSNGQGSPFIRGFTGFRTLLLIDGIRLNNSVFREGPNQYWNTVDLFTADRMEVFKGPCSVLYGSDAIGGTLNVITKDWDSLDADRPWGGRFYVRGASAENSLTGRSEIGGSIDDKFSVLLGLTYKDFGDINAGGDLGELPKTGYDETDGDLKLKYSLTPDSELLLAYQNADIDDAWRTHSTIFSKSWEGTTVGSDKERILDQERELTYLQYRSRNMESFIDSMILSLSYQTQEEIQHRVRKDNRSDDSGFDVGTTGTWAQFESSSSIGILTYGIEYYHDSVDSFADSFNADGSFKGSEIQGPVADDSEYDMLGTYVQDQITITECLDVFLGLRYTFASVDAEKIKDPITGEQVSFEDDWDNIVGSARFVQKLGDGDHWRLFGGISEGFRAPNLSDLTRLDTARTNELETPFPNLEPEEFVSYEIGLSSVHPKWSGEISYYYTDINNMINRTPTGRIIDGSNEVTKENTGDGFIHGVEIAADRQIFMKFSVFGSLAWQDGEVEDYPTSERVLVTEPISRLMPLSGNIGVRWNDFERHYWIETFCTIADKQDDLSAADKEDTSRIPPGGTPGYTVATIRGGWDIKRNLTISAAIENITDEEYRIHGSGQNEPGRNFILSLDWRF